MIDHENSRMGLVELERLGLVKNLVDYLSDPKSSDQTNASTSTSTSTSNDDIDIHHLSSDSILELVRKTNRDSERLFLSDFCIDVIILSIIKTLLSTSITDNFQHQQSINISNTHYNYQSSSTAITRLLKLRQIFLGSKKLNENNSTGLAPHLVKRIFTRLMRIVVKDHHSSKDRTYRLEDVPFLLRLSNLGYERGLEEVDPFGCTQQESKNILVHESSNSLVLDDRLELELIRSPQLKLFGSCLTLLNLSGCSKLIDSDVIHLHSTLGKTLAGIILDFTSVTDTGLGHLSRAASQDYPLKSNSNLFLLNETNEDFNTLSLTEPFGKLAMISLKGLKLVTDRCALKLCRFTNLKVIDLSGTSCTSAFRTIINKNSPSNFKCAISEDETRLFSNYLTWSQKLHEVTRYRTLRRMTQSSEEDLNLAEDTQESRRCENWRIFEIKQRRKMSPLRSLSFSAGSLQPLIHLISYATSSHFTVGPSSLLPEDRSKTCNNQLSKSFLPVVRKNKLNIIVDGDLDGILSKKAKMK